MYRSVPAQIDENGKVVLMEPVHLPGKADAIVTILGSLTPEPSEAAALDAWSAYRARLAEAGLSVPAVGKWTRRAGEALRIGGNPVSQTLVEDRR